MRAASRIGMRGGYHRGCEQGREEDALDDFRINDACCAYRSRFRHTSLTLAPLLDRLLAENSDSRWLIAMVAVENIAYDRRCDRGERSRRLRTPREE